MSPIPAQRSGRSLTSVTKMLSSFKGASGRFYGKRTAAVPQEAKPGAKPSLIQQYTNGVPVMQNVKRGQFGWPLYNLLAGGKAKDPSTLTSPALQSVKITKVTGKALGSGKASDQAYNPFAEDAPEGEGRSSFSSIDEADEGVSYNPFADPVSEAKDPSSLASPVLQPVKITKVTGKALGSGKASDQAYNPFAEGAPGGEGHSSFNSIDDGEEAGSFNPVEEPHNPFADPNATPNSPSEKDLFTAIARPSVKKRASHANDFSGAARPLQDTAPLSAPGSAEKPMQREPIVPNVNSGSLAKIKKNLSLAIQPVSDFIQSLRRQGGIALGRTGGLGESFSKWVIQALKRWAPFADPGAKVAGTVGTVGHPVKVSADGDSVRRDRYSSILTYTPDLEYDGNVRLKRYSGIQEGNSDWDVLEALDLPDSAIESWLGK
ncbi:hypothetical protein PDO_5187, partial [Rhizobium sp. PDO1-076]|uniref:hypothetical protein n=1 Tax=Rhizobium sp. PDO1-076 TaxID=1125979 RepID=UPI00024E3E90